MSDKYWHWSFIPPTASTRIMIKRRLPSMTSSSFPTCCFLSLILTCSQCDVSRIRLVPEWEPWPSCMESLLSRPGNEGEQWGLLSCRYGPRDHRRASNVVSAKLLSTLRYIKISFPLRLFFFSYFFPCQNHYGLHSWGIWQSFAHYVSFCQWPGELLEKCSHSVGLPRPGGSGVSIKSLSSRNASVQLAQPQQPQVEN